MEMKKRKRPNRKVEAFQPYVHVVFINFFFSYNTKKTKEKQKTKKLELKYRPTGKKSRLLIRENDAA